MFTTKGKESASTSVVLKPGIDIKAVLENVSLSDDGKNTLIFKFKGTDPKNNGTFSHKEFEIDPTHERYTEESADRVLSRIKHIVTRFISDEVIDSIEASSWSAYCTKMIGALGKSYVNVPVEIKVTVNKSGYNQFPLFPNFISSELKPAVLTTNIKFDKYEAVAPSNNTSTMDVIDEPAF